MLFRLTEIPLDGIQSSQNTLRIVQAFHTKYDFFVVVGLAILVQVLMVFIRPQLLQKFFRINTDWINADSGGVRFSGDEVHFPNMPSISFSRLGLQRNNS
jgi:hypothetical protein